ncbi:MAG TPA: Ig-like domain-containing protein, partial [Kofleriaceae bacterium]
MRWLVAFGCMLVACGDSTSSPTSAKPGVVFTYPVDGQVDVPQGANVLVTLSAPVTQSALACTMSGSSPSGGFCLVGPNGPVMAMPAVSSDGLTVSYTGLTMDAGAAYGVYVGADLAPFAQNLPSGPLAHFTTRSNRPKSAVPTLVAINGGDPANPTSFRPMLEATTIELVFSEPLDPRTCVLAPGAFELLDPTGTEVLATLFTDGIHVAIDPMADLTAGVAYTLKVGSKVVDQGGQAMTPAMATLTPLDSRMGAGPIAQTLRTRGSGDPGEPSSRFGVTPGEMNVDSPLIGSNSAQFESSTLAAELGNPEALTDKSIAFTIRRGARLSTTGLTVQLGGQVPVGLQTGDIYIELLTDGGGRLYRNPHQDPSQSPDNAAAPIYVDFSLDVGVFAVDPAGNATLAQTILGVQAVGAVAATDGVLDIETYASMDLGLLGVTVAPINLDLELITDPSSSPAADTTPPTLVTTYPAKNEDAAPIDTGIELVFSEPIDLDTLPAGSIKLVGGTATIPTVLESHGSVVVMRPLDYLARNTQYTIEISGVTDVAGNMLAQTAPIGFKTEDLSTSNANPLTVSAVHPGVACALVGATATSPGRCSGGGSGDDLYQPFTLPADQPI